MDVLVQMTTTVVACQSQVGAGVLVNIPLPILPDVLQRARAEGFFHLLVPVGAVAVAVASPGVSVQQSLQGLLHRALFLAPWRSQVQAGLCKSHWLLSRGWLGRLGRKN